MTRPDSHMSSGVGFCRGIEACEKCVLEIHKEFERLNLDYSIDYHPLRRGVEVIDNTNGMTSFDFQTLGETLKFFQALKTEAGCGDASRLTK